MQPVSLMPPSCEGAGEMLPGTQRPPEALLQPNAKFQEHHKSRLCRGRALRQPASTLAGGQALQSAADQPEAQPAAQTSAEESALDPGQASPASGADSGAGASRADRRSAGKRPRSRSRLGLKPPVIASTPEVCLFTSCLAYCSHMQKAAVPMLFANPAPLCKPCGQLQHA